MINANAVLDWVGEPFFKLGWIFAVVQVWPTPNQFLGIRHASRVLYILQIRHKLLRQFVENHFAIAE